MLRQMIYRFGDAALPLSPVLQVALAKQHVYTSWTGHELVYIVASTCPNPDEVKAAIGWRQRLLRLAAVLEVIITVAVFLVIGSLETKVFAVK